MSVPSMAIAPGETMSCAAFCVTTVPPTTTSEIARRAGCAASTATASTAAALTVASARFMSGDCSARYRFAFAAPCDAFRSDDQSPDLVFAWRHGRQYGPLQAQL